MSNGWQVCICIIGPLCWESLSAFPIKCQYFLNDGSLHKGPIVYKRHFRVITSSEIAPCQFIRQTFSSTYCNLCSTIGPCLKIKTVFPDMGVSIVKIKQSKDRLIFIMGIPILVRYLIETAPQWFSNIYCSCHCFIITTCQRVTWSSSVQNEKTIWCWKCPIC